jgi:hypothetical protein
MRRNVRFPVPLKDSNAPGIAKRDTLEFFVFNPGWHKPAEFDDDPVVGGPISLHGFIELDGQECILPLVNSTPFQRCCRSCYLPLIFNLRLG